MIDLSPIRDRLTALSPYLDERGRRLLAATEALPAGYGGIARTVVGKMLNAQKFSLQGHHKTLAEGLSPDRDAQFHHFNENVAKALADNQPAISAANAGWVCVQDNRVKEVRPRGSAALDPGQRRAFGILPLFESGF